MSLRTRLLLAISTRWPQLLLPLLVLLLALWQPTRVLDRWWYDQQQAWLTLPQNDQIVVVAIDDASLRLLGRWPWSRALHAELLQQLHTARAVGLDVVFAEPSDAQADTQLANAISQHGRVALPVFVDRSRQSPQMLLPLPSLANRAAALGHVDLNFDGDGVVRRLYLQAGIGDTDFPALPMAMLQAGGVHPRNPTAIVHSISGDWVTADPLLLAFGDVTRRIRVISAADVLLGKISPEEWREKWVLIGVTATGTGDLAPTPVRWEDRPLAGVMLNAVALDNLLRHDQIHPLAWWLEIMVWLLLWAAALWCRRWRRGGMVGLLIVIALVWGASATLLHNFHWWFAPFPASLLVLAGGVLHWHQRQQQVTAPDPLGSVLDHPRFEARLQQLRELAQQQQQPLALFIADLDWFKRYNDRYGTIAGDLVLRQIGKALQAHVAGIGEVLRCGGEEFALVLPYDQIQAETFGTALLQRIHDLHLTHEDTPCGVITVSLGIALLAPTIHIEPTLWVSFANLALYEAKDGGRNRLSIQVVPADV